jgi:hypothetical protein
MPRNWPAGCRATCRRVALPCGGGCRRKRHPPPRRFCRRDLVAGGTLLPQGCRDCRPGNAAGTGFVAPPEGWNCGGESGAGTAESGCARGGRTPESVPAGLGSPPVTPVRRGAWWWTGSVRRWLPRADWPGCPGPRRWTRSVSRLRQWLAMQSAAWRGRVRFVAIDMCTVFVSAIRRCGHRRRSWSITSMSRNSPPTPLPRSVAGSPPPPCGDDADDATTPSGTSATCCVAPGRTCRPRRSRN